MSIEPSEKRDSLEQLDTLAHLPSLNRDRSFWAMVVTQFLGAFNDNFFKQLMLLLAVPVVASSAAAASASSSGDDQQGLATVVFALPFVVLSGLAGYLSDRYSKRTVIVISKVAEIVVMALGLFAFLNYSQIGYGGLLVVLGLMGTQSTFFGPGKYGILPESFRKSDLPRANGVILMTTFLAIIFGTASAGGLKNLFARTSDMAGGAGAERLWVGSLFCIVIAVIGTGTSTMIRRVPAAEPNLKFGLASMGVTREAWRAVRDDLPLAATLLATCVFWLVSGVTIQAVNSLGLVQLRVGDLRTSILTAMIGMGIAVGAVIAGRMSHGRVDFRIVRIGSWCLVLLSIPMALVGPSGEHLLGFGGSLVILALMGMAAGFFAIPLQVFVQERPSADIKGRIIALMNQANFVAILLSGVCYELCDRVVTQMGWPRSTIFVVIAFLMLPVALFYRPRNTVTSATEENPF